MAELEKISRVIKKRLDGAPHEVLLVLDATTGQNMAQQAELFSKAAPVTGLLLAKLDGTAKGGAVFGLRERNLIPVKFVGLGEKLDDLEAFDPKAFVDAIVEPFEALEGAAEHA
jgi:fused signal recognition particle receptor